MPLNDIGQDARNVDQKEQKFAKRVCIKEIETLRNVK